MVAIVHLLLLACVLSELASVDASNYFAVVAPNVIRFNHEETVSVSIFESLRNTEVKVWLEHNGKRFSENEVNIQDKNHPQTVTIKVTEEDLFDKELVDRAKHVTLKAACAGYPVQSAQLLVNYHSGYLIVQTDKPIYTPGQAVNCRVLALDEGLNAATNIPLTIDIIDPRNRTLRRTKRLVDPSNYSAFYAGRPFDIPKHTEYGLWTIRASYQGQFSTEGRAIFEVQEYTLPTFDVNVKVTEPCVVPTTATLHVSVEGRYVYGKPVQGSVSLHINVSSKAGSDFAMKIKATKLWHNGIYEFVVNMTKLYASSAIQNGNFADNFPPTGYRLDIRADVFEQATGNVETGLAKVIFAQSPYMFKFDRSRKTYRPGLAYDLQVEVLLANGKALSNEVIEITKTVGGKAETYRMQLLNNGLLYKSFQTEHKFARQPHLVFKVRVDGVWSDEFRVSPLEGPNQVKVELITTYIIARGTIVHSEYFGVARNLKYDIDAETFKLLSPYARAVAYYFDFKTNEVVSDGVGLYIEPPSCRGAGLSMRTDYDFYRPGGFVELTLTGVPFMDVRLNWIDKALLYLNSDNILHTDKMLNLLKRHDVGCGVGDGSSSSEIIKNAGLVMLTNANLKNMRRDSLSCTGNRRKRAINEGKTLSALQQVQRRSLYDESDYLSDIERMDLDEMIPRFRFEESRLFHEKTTLSFNGVYNVRLYLPDSSTALTIQAIGFSHIYGVCIANPVDIRGFKEFFIQLDMPYSAVRFEIVSLKVTVFNYYKGTAMVKVYLEGVPDLCSSARPGFKSPRQEGEINASSAMTFTFHVRPLKIKKYDITVHALADFSAVSLQDAVTRTLSVKGEGKRIIKTIHACLDPNNKLRTCENDKGIKEYRVRGTQDLEIKLERPPEAIPDTFFAVGYIKTDLVADIVKTFINGTESLMGLPIGNGATTTAKLAHTVYAMAYVKEKNQVTAAIETQGTRFIISGVERVTQYRQGDNSYGISRSVAPSTWLTAFVMKVFCQAQKVVENIDTATHIVPSLQWLLTQQKHGVFFDDKPVSYRSMIGQLDEKDSSLTAFVIISFMECDGKISVMNSTVNEAVKYLEDLYPAAYTNDDYLLAISTYALALAGSPKKHEFMKMLKNKANIDGAKMYWGEPGGSPANAQSVETTGYALLAYLTFHNYYDSASIVRWLIQQRGGKGAFRTTMDTVVGLQALTEYSKRTKKEDVDLVVSILNGDRVIDVMVKPGKIEIEKVPIKDDATQLIVRVKGTGGAYLDIDYGYNVLQETRCPFNVSEIRIRNITDAPPIEPILAYAGGCDVCGFCAYDKDPNNFDYYIDPFNFDYDDPEQLELPSSSGGFTRNRKSLNSRRRNAELGDPKLATKYCVDFEISSEKKTGMAMVSFGLQTGVRVEQRDLDELVDSHAVARYEMPEEGKSFVIFYVSELRPDPVRFKFRLIDEQADDAERRQAANVDIYEYYRPERSCNKFYDVYVQQKTPASYTCVPGKKQNCVCLQSVCAQSFDSKIKKLFANKRRPAFGLKDRICNSDKANYAVLVKMKTPILDKVKQQYTVNATVEISIHGGILRKNDKMTFRYKAFCKYPTIEAGRMYYVIANSDEKGMYELMGDAVVIKQRRGVLKRVMGAFTKLMRENGCNS